MSSRYVFQPVAAGNEKFMMVNPTTRNVYISNDALTWTLAGTLPTFPLAGSYDHGIGALWYERGYWYAQLNFINLGNSLFGSWMAISANDGVSWSTLITPVAATDTGARVDSDATNTLVVYRTGEVYRHTTGSTLTSLSNLSSLYPADYSPSDKSFEVLNTGTNTFAVMKENILYTTTNGGTSWTRTAVTGLSKLTLDGKGAKRIARARNNWIALLSRTQTVAPTTYTVLATSTNLTTWTVVYEFGRTLYEQYATFALQPNSVF